MFEIEILRPGTFTSSNGQKVKLTQQKLKQIVASYNPSNFRAPLIVSHDTQGVNDVDLSATELAYGTPSRLRLDNGRVTAVFEKISPQFVDWVQNGQLLNVSASLYSPKTSTNPSGKLWSLRHIAALGKTPPAIKGLQPLSLQAWDKGEIGVLNFAQFDLDEDDAQNQDYAAKLAQLLEDSAISTEGLAEALDIPLADVEAFLTGEQIPTEEQMMAIAALLQPMDEEEGDDAGSTDMAEAARILQRLNRKEQQLRRRELNEFVEGLYAEGRLVPGLIAQPDLVEFMDSLSERKTIDLSERGAVTQLEVFQKLLQRLPKLVDFGESLTDWDENPANRTPKTLARRILDYQADQKNKGNTVDVITALARLKG